MSVAAHPVRRQGHFRAAFNEALCQNILHNERAGCQRRMNRVKCLLTGFRNVDHMGAFRPHFLLQGVIRRNQCTVGVEPTQPHGSGSTAIHDPMRVNEGNRHIVISPDARQMPDSAGVRALLQRVPVITEVHLPVPDRRDQLGAQSHPCHYGVSLPDCSPYRIAERPIGRLLREQTDCIRQQRQ